MEKSNIKHKKTIGILIIILTILLLGLTIIISIFLLGFGWGMPVSQLLPFFGLTLVKLVILCFAFYLAIQLIKEKPLPFPQNNYLATIVIVVGIIYFSYWFFTILYDNISGSNPGAWLQLILAFLWGLILVLIGIGAKNK